MPSLCPSKIMLHATVGKIFLLAISGVFLALSGCSRQPPDFHLNNVAGHMPDLKLFGAKNAHGRVRSATDYRGKVVVLYFGYTHCPDACPLTLSKLHQALQQLGPEAKMVEVLFVTVDPQRDTDEVLRRYVRAFDPQFHALRPTEQALASITRRCHVGYRYGQPDADGNYAVGHSSGVFIFDGNGTMRLIGTSADTAADMAADIEKLTNTGVSWWRSWL